MSKHKFCTRCDGIGPNSDGVVSRLLVPASLLVVWDPIPTNLSLDGQEPKQLRSNEPFVALPRSSTDDDVLLRRPPHGSIRSASQHEDNAKGVSAAHPAAACSSLAVSYAWRATSVSRWDARQNYVAASCLGHSQVHPYRNLGWTIMDPLGEVRLSRGSPTDGPRFQWWAILSQRRFSSWVPCLACVSFSAAHPTPKTPPGWRGQDDDR